MSWGSSDLIINNVRIHYYQTGNSLRQVVLLHGFSDNALCFERVGRELEKEYSIILPDARGHGFSDAPSFGYGVEENAQDLAELIKRLKLRKPFLVGHSMGANTATLTAATYPNMIGGVILEDPVWRYPPLSKEESLSKIKKNRELIEKLKSMTAEEIMKYGMSLHPDWDEREFQQWSKSKLQMSVHVLDSFSRDERDWREILQKVTCPALLITGDLDKCAIVSPASALQAKSIAQKLEVVHIDEAGHNIRRDRFEKYLEAINSFLKQHLI